MDISPWVYHSDSDSLEKEQGDFLSEEASGRAGANGLAPCMTWAPSSSAWQWKVRPGCSLSGQ